MDYLQQLDFTQDVLQRPITYTQVHSMVLLRRCRSTSHTMTDSHSCSRCEWHQCTTWPPKKLGWMQCTFVPHARTPPKCLQTWDGQKAHRCGICTGGGSDVRHALTLSQSAFCLLCCCMQHLQQPPEVGSIKARAGVVSLASRRAHGSTRSANEQCSMLTPADER